MNDFLAYVGKILPGMLSGFGVTLQLFGLTLLLSIPLGLVISFGSMSRILPIKGLAKFYVWLFRGTPLMLQLFVFYYGFGIIAENMGWYFLRWDRFPAAVITFVLNYAAYFSEIFRAGIESIDKGQFEAARALGFTRRQTMFSIIIPQTVRRVIPPASNETITLIKDTALVNVISVAEMMKVAKDRVSTDSNLTGYLIAALLYLLFTFVLTIIYRRLEKRFSRHEQEAV